LCRDILKLLSRLARISINEELSDVMTDRLCNPEQSLNPLLLAEYNCGDLHPWLNGMLLSRHSITIAAAATADAQVQLDICDECKASLKRPSSFPPKFAIANHFFIDRLPDDLFSAKWPEFLMCSLVSVIAQTRVLRGGIH